MLICFSSELISYFQKKSPSELEVIALDNIVASHRKGYHFVIGNRQTLTYLQKIKGLGHANINQLKTMLKLYSTSASLVTSINNKIEVVSSDEEFQIVRKLIDNEISSGFSLTFRVPLKKFYEDEFLEKTRILSEHQDDCFFYKFMAQEAFKLKNLPGKLMVDTLHGGGSDTHKIFENKIKEGHIIFAVVDSDKKSPTHNIGRTAQQVQRIFKKYKDLDVIDFEIIPFHEKENLLSPVLHNLMVKNIKNSALLQLEVLSKTAVNSAIFPYVDLKEGLHSENYNPYFECLFEIEGFLPKLDTDIKMFDKQFVGTKQEFEEYCTNQSRLRKNEREKLYLLEPLGEGLLKDFNFDEMLTELESQISERRSRGCPEEIIRFEEYKFEILKQSYDNLYDFQKDYFKLLGSKIAEWCLANSRRII